MRSADYRKYLPLAAITALALGLRLYRLDAQGVWFDEAFSIANSVLPVRDLMAQLVDDFFHPPLHYLTLHWWFQIFGLSVYQARLGSVVFGTLSVPLLYRLTREFASPATSLTAALLLAVSQMGVYFSQEARPYEQAQFFSLVTACALLPLLRAPSGWRITACATAGVALIYTHYYGLACLGALALYWMAFRADYPRPGWIKVVAALALMGLAYIPWLIALTGVRQDDQERHILGDVRQPSQRATLSSPLSALGRFNNGKLTSIEAPASAMASAAGLLLFTLPLCVGGWRARGDARKGLVLGCLMAGSPLALALLMSALGLIFNYRHYSFAVPGYCLAVAIGWETCFPNPRVRMGWMALAVGFSLLALRANYFGATKPDYRAGLLPMAEGFQPGDCATTGPHFWRDNLHFAWTVYFRDRGTPRAVPARLLPNAAAGCQRLWVIRDKTWWMYPNRAAWEPWEERIASLRGTFDAQPAGDHPSIELRRLVRKTQED